MSLGVSADVAVGQKVYAIGNPFGLDHTLTTGIVSGIHREIQSGITGRPIQDAIQVRPARPGGRSTPHCQWGHAPLLCACAAAVGRPECPAHCVRP